MTEDEYLLMDELYFVRSFADLVQHTGWEESKMREMLLLLISDKGWVKALINRDTEIEIIQQEFELNSDKYLYIATKKGLFALNST